MEAQGEAEQGCIKLTLTYPRVPNLTYNFKLTITVNTQQMDGRSPPLLNKTLLTAEKKISIGPFPGGKIYKVTCVGMIGGQEYSKIIFVFVGSWGNQEEQEPQQQQQHRHIVRPRSQQRHESYDAKRNAKSSSTFSNSEDLMKMVGKSVGITNQKTLDRFILKGRNCRNTKQFIGKRNSDCLKKQEMLIKGKLILNDVYKQKEGMHFFKNDWFMGPFYSYNHNEKKMAE